jgi:uncharacterized protein (TIGR02996 family)
VNSLDPFLSQVVATPDDKSLRLVYADWLEERGDPRSELIRVEGRMADLAPFAEEYATLRARRNELRQAADRKWLTAMGYVARHQPLFTRLPSSRDARWRLVEEFIDVWYRPLSTGDGYSEEELAAAESRLGCRLPPALREWYALSGKRRDVWSKQDHFQAPSQLHFHEDGSSLIIRGENQWCEMWGIRARDLELEDPPVYELLDPARASLTLTAFAIAVMMYEVKFASGILAAGGQVPDQLTRREVRPLRRCQLPSRYWVGSPVHFYEDTDIIVETEGHEWVYVTARAAEAFEQLGEEFRSHLEQWGRSFAE